MTCENVINYSSNLIRSHTHTRARDLRCYHAESTARRLEAQLAEAAERNRRMERLSQVKPRCE